MSQLQNLIDRMHDQQRKLGLSNEDTAGLLMSILDALDWEILTEEDNKELALVAPCSSQTEYDNFEFHLEAQRIRTMLGFE